MKPKKPKVIETYHKARKRAIDGDPPADEVSRVARLGYKAGKRIVASVERLNAPLIEAKKRELDNAIAAAQGVNKQALQVLDVAADIPHQDASYPGWGAQVISDKNESASSVMQWTNSFTFGPSKDPTRPSATPLEGDKPVIVVDNADWPHNPLRIPVDNVHITVEAPMLGDGLFGPATTRVHINSREYDPNSPLSDESGYTGEAGFSFDADGTLVSVGLGQEDWAGFPKMDAATTTVNMEAFLLTLDMAAYRTRELFDIVGEI